ncbi:hypothetical protein C8J56DRAFT_781663 [Mycena floridula]|nr:hypothetical protein C8J56DRAFT_781663 [Mycena floridula]
MPLFRAHPIRSTVAVFVSLAAGHAVTRFFSSWHAFHLTQTAVALLAIASLMLLVTMHHRREGQLLTQTTEEMILIGGFCLFWIAVLLAWRAFTHSSISAERAGELNLVGGRDGGPRRDPGFTGGVLPYPCSGDDLYCTVEEWSFF